MSSNLANPFKGLQSYDRADSEKLFGRDRDLILMKDRIFSARTTLLFAGSGVGKTSFLNAKIIPELENLYCIFYHNRWAGPSRPLDAVKRTLAESIEAAGKDGPLINSFRQFSGALPSSPTPAPNGDNGDAPPAQCLLILDQFEEIFQYHAYEDYFKRFLNELCEVVRTDEYRVHVVFSMREEFLGELSVFDNLIPDLFNNYYRLKYPDTREARQIIEGTCSIASTKVHKDNLTELIRDLSRIEKGAAGAAERSLREHGITDHVIERSFIIPPYLQITCHRHWQNQAEKAAKEGGDGFVFLEDYQSGQAQKMLREFCQEKLSTLSFMEQNFAAQSFDFLVTKQGAKMAYEFTSLADHMRVRVFRGKLRQALEKLSAPETRILRKSHGPDGSLWFELYHDIYGKILDTWRQSFRRRKQRAAVGIGIATLALLLILIPVTWHWIVSPRAYENIIKDAHLEKREDYKGAEAAYKSLHNTWGYESYANSLWAKAWERRAGYAESHNKRDEAIICWLQALSLDPDGPDAERWRLKAGYLTRGNYQQLRGNLHHDNDVETSVFSADGRLIVTQSIDKKIYVWDSSTGELLGKHSNPPVIRSAATGRQGGGESNGATPPAQRAPAETADKGTQPYSPHGSGKENAGEGPQQYNPKAVALHPKLGWLVAATLTSDIPRGLGDNKKREKYAPQQVSFLSNSGELLDTPVVSEAASEGAAHVALSADGEYVATDGRGEHTRVWKLDDRTFKPAEGFRASGYIYGFTFSPDSRYLFARGESDKLLFWEVGSGKLLYQPIRIPNLISCQFSPDGNLFVTVSESTEAYQIKVWETATGKSLGTPINLRESQFNFNPKIIIRPDGKALIYKLEDPLSPEYRSFQVFDLQTGKLQGETFRIGMAGRVKFVFSPNGELMLTYQGKELRLFSIGGEQVQGPTMKTDTAIIQTVLSRDGKLIVTLTDMSPESSKRRAAWSGMLGEWDERVYNKVAQAWDAETSAPVGNPISNVIAVSADGKYLVRREQKKGPIQILDVRTGNEVMNFVYPDPYLFDELFASPSGKFFATYADSGQRPYSGSRVYLWEANGASTPDAPIGIIFGRSYLDQDYFVSRISRHSIIFSPDERFFSFSGGTSVVKVWQLSPRQPIELSNNLSGVATLAFNQHGQLLGGGANVARVWDMSSHQQLYNDLETNSDFISVALSPDGKMALTGGGHGTVSLWSLANGVATRNGSEMNHGEDIWSVNFSDDGKKGVIMAGAWLHVLDVGSNTYKESYFLGENWLHNCRSLSDDGSRLRCLFQLNDKTLKVGEIQSGQILGAAPIAGNPSELFSSWMRRLGLKIDEGQIVPAGPSDRDANSSTMTNSE